MNICVFADLLMAIVLGYMLYSGNRDVNVMISAGAIVLAHLFRVSRNNQLWYAIDGFVFATLLPTFF